MRAGGYTVQQSLTAEAAAVLRMALALARGRGHAQVTPLHVAFTLLGSSAACAYGLLRRACARAHPAPPPPSQCRALELCFNVALNRLPATASSSPLSSPSSSPSPTLSNALVAALKRAQANQRRGCVELQQPPLTAAASPPQLTIKVELEQLAVSILDDPSVSRVMREAGFSSAKVKASLEDDTAMLLTRAHHASTPPHLFLQPRTADLESSPGKQHDRDVDAIMEVMSRKQQQQHNGRGRRSNPVLLSDSASAAEASAAALTRRLETGGGGSVPAELRGAHVLRLHLSRVHVRLMARADVDAWAADLRRTVASCANTASTRAAGLVIYVGDMGWAVDDDDAHSQPATPPRYSPARHVAAALARLLAELPACWLVAAASYGTYMRCQRRALDATWALQPVPVGAGGGLGLGLGPGAAASPKDGRITKPSKFPLSGSETKQDDDVAALCVECARNFEREASAVRAKAQGTNLALSCFPGWPQADEPRTSHTDDLVALKRKWSRLCQRVHMQQHSQPARPFTTAKSSDPGLCLALESPTCHETTRKVINHRDAETTLSLRLPSSAAPPMPEDEIHRHRSADLDCNLTIGDLKRKAESVQLHSEPKRRCGLDLNVCAEEEEDGADGSCSEDEPVPSDLTNDGEGSSGDDVANTLDSHN